MLVSPAQDATFLCKIDTSVPTEEATLTCTPFNEEKPAPSFQTKHLKPYDFVGALKTPLASRHIEALPSSDNPELPSQLTAEHLARAQGVYDTLNRCYLLAKRATRVTWETADSSLHFLLKNKRKEIYITMSGINNIAEIAAQEILENASSAKAVDLILTDLDDHANIAKKRLKSLFAEASSAGDPPPEQVSGTSTAPAAPALAASGATQAASVALGPMLDGTAPPGIVPEEVVEGTRWMADAVVVWARKSPRRVFALKAVSCSGLTSVYLGAAAFSVTGVVISSLGVAGVGVPAAIGIGLTAAGSILTLISPLMMLAFQQIWNGLKTPAATMAQADADAQRPDLAGADLTGADLAGAAV